MQNRSPNAAEGIDVSRYQGTIDWKRVRADGKSFAFIKASQGQRYVDPTFITNAKGIKAAGLLLGAYHFVDATNVNAAKAEARHFAEVLEQVGGVKVLDLPAVMDYENNPGSLSSAAIHEIALAFLTEFERVSGSKPMVYTGNAFATHFKVPLGSYKLWIARYSTRVPNDTTPWKLWDFWQYSDSGRVEGIQGPVDLNVYAGTEAELRQAFAGEEGEEPMTAEEKAAFKTLQQQVAALENSKDVLKQTLNEQSAYIKKVDQRVAELEARQTMPVPIWAKEAMAAAVAFHPASPIVDAKLPSSYDFYRLLVVLNRLGVFKATK
ncbi:glycoside hydrolase family 25 protein [Paenibacillus polymyxa]|uniref:Glycoside hydrolase family 25 protein n=1 Tax=Paenibacillus polymyxa TaxID=1406 RepID=A0A8I1LP68_PAEPO|nr:MULTISPECIES: glycoside hydrolase family 25 protein [Paenibacillus]KAF6576447.1 glycoside hydrolase family 25 protein [Paenibacillus sp. EKM206P]KAF6591419.1 glycoside hydrolase family 25 protein [Paenibacillus sp. EKM205P]MBM0632111.1 glycoside hydrolase family 25 protein [Paenibacillus polymyxa]